MTSTTFATEPFSVNGRTYCPPPRPLVVICIDGCADDYISESLGGGRMPALARMLRTGYRCLVRGALPSFTNVNNASIVTGVPPSRTGISGNFFLDPETGEEVMMNSSRYLRCETILAAAANTGRKVAMVTAKEKLRNLLSLNLQGIAFSAENAGEAKQETHGIGGIEELVGKPTPEIYSGEASLYVLDAGATLLERGMADFLYLTLSDYVQHKHTPQEAESLEFYGGIDKQIGRLLEMNALLGITADHGMNGKTAANGKPNILYLGSLLREEFGSGIGVICPITDPYVLHHGALGGMVYVHLEDTSRAEQIARWTLEIPGVTEVYQREIAAEKLELPIDRIGDLVVMCASDYVLGRTPEDHDLSLLGDVLRSHGGRSEEMVPMLLSQMPAPRHVEKSDTRSFDIFEFLCSGDAP